MNLEKENNLFLKEGERIDDLERNGYKIIQDRKRFCFGMDAVLLSGFAQVKENEKVLDMGTGTGIIPILLEAKTVGEDFYALEIQQDSADMAKRSVILNHLEEKVHIVRMELHGMSYDICHLVVASVVQALHRVQDTSLNRLQ